MAKVATVDKVHKNIKVNEKQKNENTHIVYNNNLVGDKSLQVLKEYEEAQKKWEIECDRTKALTERWRTDNNITVWEFRRMFVDFDYQIAHLKEACNNTKLDSKENKKRLENLKKFEEIYNKIKAFFVRLRMYKEENGFALGITYHFRMEKIMKDLLKTRTFYNGEANANMVGNELNIIAYNMYRTEVEYQRDYDLDQAQRHTAKLHNALKEILPGSNDEVRTQIHHSLKENLTQFGIEGVKEVTEDIADIKMELQPESLQSIKKETEKIQKQTKQLNTLNNKTKIDVVNKKSSALLDMLVKTRKMLNSIDVANAKKSQVANEVKCVKEFETAANDFAQTMENYQGVSQEHGDEITACVKEFKADSKNTVKNAQVINKNETLARVENIVKQKDCLTDLLEDYSADIPSNVSFNYIKTLGSEVKSERRNLQELNSIKGMNLSPNYLQNLNNVAKEIKNTYFLQTGLTL